MIRIAALLMGCQPILARTAEPVIVEVHFTVHDWQGQPVADAPVEADIAGSWGFGFTNAIGEATVSIKRYEDQKYVLAGLSSGFGTAGSDNYPHAKSRFLTLTENYLAPDMTVITLPPEAQSVTAAIVLKEAVQVQGRLVRDDASAFNGSIGLWQSQNAVDVASNSDGTFVLRGVGKHTASRLIVGVSEPQAWVIDLAAAQLNANLNLGDVSLHVAARPVTAVLKVTNSARLVDTDLEPTEHEMSLIRSDGLVLLRFRCDDQTGKAGEGFDELLPGPVHVAPGTYYVAPGLIGSFSSMRVLDMVRRGHQGDLDAAGVPKFIAVEGQTVRFAFDARAAYTAIMGSAPIEVLPPPTPPSGP